jgi:hypothetical protein
MVALDESRPGAAHAGDRLRNDEMIWLITVRADGQPQTSAVWFHWDGADFLLVSQPTAGKLRNIAGDPGVSLNLNGVGHGADLVVVDRPPDPTACTVGFRLLTACTSAFGLLTACTTERE